MTLLIKLYKKVQLTFVSERVTLWGGITWALNDYILTEGLSDQVFFWLYLTVYPLSRPNTDKIPGIIPGMSITGLPL